MGKGEHNVIEHDLHGTLVSTTNSRIRLNGCSWLVVEMGLKSKDETSV